MRQGKTFPESIDLSKYVEGVNDDEPCEKIESDLLGFYVFGIEATVNHKPEVSFNVKSNALYKICFSPGKAKSITGCSTLSFTRLTQMLVISEHVESYEAYFTKDFLNKETIMLSEKLELFKPALPKMFFVSKHQECRIKDFFESLLNESTKTDLYRNEMIRTLIHILILLTQRLASVPFP